MRWCRECQYFWQCEKHGAGLVEAENRGINLGGHLFATYDEVDDNFLKIPRGRFIGHGMEEKIGVPWKSKKKIDFYGENVED